METVICQNCKKEFKVWKAWIKKGSGKNCSRKCAYQSRKGKPSYTRTSEHKLKMSSLKKDSPYMKECSERFKKLNLLKKGKTWEELYGIEKAQACRKLFREINSGKNNGNYIDGRSFFPYTPGFTKLLKEKIIKRDNFVCKGCGITNLELKEKDFFGRGLTIHHIDYNKNNNLESNLIALCRTCNSKANSNREYHQNYYANKI